MSTVNILIALGLVESKSQARRVLAQKAVTIDGVPVESTSLPPHEAVGVWCVGKKCVRATLALTAEAV